MVFMAVRDDDAAQLMLVFEHVGVIGQNEIDARMIVVGKHQARIDQQHVVAAFEYGHVLSDGVKTAERDDFQRRRGVALHCPATTRPGRALRGVAGARLAESFDLALAFGGYLRTLVLEGNCLMARRTTSERNKRCSRRSSVRCRVRLRLALRLTTGIAAVAVENASLCRLRCRRLLRR